MNLIPRKGTLYALAVDALLWLGGTYWIFSEGYPDVAALVGAFGIVYVLHALNVLKRRKAQAAAFAQKQQEEMERFKAFLNDSEHVPEVQIRSHQFDTREDLLHFMQLLKDDPEAALEYMAEKEKAQRERMGVDTPQPNPEDNNDK